MIETLRRLGICKRGGLLAALLVAAVFVSSQAVCLTHDHCVESGCFEDDSAPAGHAGQQDGEGRIDHIDDLLESCGGCHGGHHGHDMHHHPRDSHTTPQRKFTSPSRDFLESAAAAAAAPDLPAAGLPHIENEAVTPYERGAGFDGRAPPIS